VITKIASKIVFLLILHQIETIILAINVQFIVLPKLSLRIIISKLKVKIRQDQEIVNNIKKKEIVLNTNSL